MLLNSLEFIFLFLPIILGLFFVFQRVSPWGYLLLASLCYYIWVEPQFFWLIFLLLAGNFFAGKILNKHTGKLLLVLSVSLNVLLLALFKTIEAGWLPPDIFTFSGISFAQSPTGISFIIFSSIAFLFDSYHQRFKEMPGLVKFGVFQLFFSKVIAGPIVRVGALQSGSDLSPTFNHIANGIRRFLRGFLKKVLIADVLGAVVDPIFALPDGQRSFSIAWIGLLFYTLQIFFDFSGYTDMALGIGKMFGLSLPENFDYPYISKSIGEFWRRWHITLSNWFRDYIFFPLERKRRRVKYWYQPFNVFLVFLLTGLWHGFTLNFIGWGLLHGFAIIFENSKFGTAIRNKLPAVIQNFYALAIVLFGWVLFRTDSIHSAAGYGYTLLKFNLQRFSMDLPVSILQPIEGLTWMAFAAGVLLSFPVPQFISDRFDQWDPPQKWAKPVLRIVADGILLFLFVIAASIQINSTFSSFLYGNF